MDEVALDGPATMIDDLGLVLLSRGVYHGDDLVLEPPQTQGELVSIEDLGPVGIQRPSHELYGPDRNEEPYVIA